MRQRRLSFDRTVVPARTVRFRWAALAIGSGSNFVGTPGAPRVLSNCAACVWTRDDSGEKMVLALARLLQRRVSGRLKLQRP